MREIVLDTETTGLNPVGGDRIVEVGCIELLNHMPTATTFHRYINPERSMPAEAGAVHGLTDAFLADKPVFADIAEDLDRFLGDAPLIIHNAAFDLGFLNAEFARLKMAPLPAERAVCTLTMARQKFPGAQASLDALCRRFAVDNAARTLHGALLDAQLLAEVYLELIGGRQPGLALAAENAIRVPLGSIERRRRAPRAHAPSAEELARHAAMLDLLGTPIWRL